MQGVISPGSSIGNATCHIIALLINTHLVIYKQDHTVSQTKDYSLNIGHRGNFRNVTYLAGNRSMN